MPPESPEGPQGQEVGVQGLDDAANAVACEGSAGEQAVSQAVATDEHIDRVVSTAPLPTPEQIARLRALLRPR